MNKDKLLHVLRLMLVTSRSNHLKTYNEEDINGMNYWDGASDTIRLIIKMIKEEEYYDIW